MLNSDKLLSILIADDHTLLRFGLKETLLDYFPSASVYEAQNFKEASSLLSKNHEIDLIILDINMPGSNDNAMKLFLKNNRSSKILIYTAYEDHILARRYLKAGADGFLNKNTSLYEIYIAIETVLNDNVFIDSQTKKKLLDLTINGDIDKQDISTLSDREFDICMSIAQGERINDIAKKLNIHISTVSTYKKRAYEKLEVSNEAELISLLKDQFII